MSFLLVERLHGTGGYGGANRDNAEIQRVTHSIIGQGITFDFLAISRVAHHMEGYIESTANRSDASVSSLTWFADTFRAVFEAVTGPCRSSLGRTLCKLSVNTRSILNGQTNERSKPFW